MNWLKVVTGFMIMAGVLLVWIRIMGQMRSRSGGSGMKMDPGGRATRRDQGQPNELEQIIAAHRAGKAAPPAAPVAALETPGPVPAGTAPSGTRPPPLLTGERRTLYLLGRAAFPECLVFPCVPATRLLGPTDAAPLPGHIFDLVVCRDDYTPVAVIDLSHPRGPNATALTLLDRQGVRYLELSAQALPRREALRARVAGIA